MPKIFLLDVTNRDGVQTARLGLSKLEKTMLNMFLNEMGVSEIEPQAKISFTKSNLPLITQVYLLSYE